LPRMARRDVAGYVKDHNPDVPKTRASLCRLIEEVDVVGKLDALRLRSGWVLESGLENVEYSSFGGCELQVSDRLQINSDVHFFPCNIES